MLGLKANQPEQPAPADKALGCRLDGEVREYLINAAKLAAKTYKAYKKSLELFQESRTLADFAGAGTRASR